MFQLLSYNVWVQILCKWKHDKQIPWSWDIPSVETFVLHLGERAFQPKSPVKTSLLIEEHLQLALCLTQPMSGTLVGGLIQEEDWLLLKIPLEIQKKPPPLLPQLSRPPPRRPPARQCAGVTDLGRDYFGKIRMLSRDLIQRSGGGRGGGISVAQQSSHPRLGQCLL